MKRGIVTKLKFLAPVIFVFLTVPNVQAEAELTMGVVLFPPDVTIDEKTKECVGSAITATKDLLLEFGVKVHVVCAPPQRIIRLLQNKQIDFTISVKSDEILSKHVVYSEIPFRKVKVNPYIRNELKQFKTISAVRGFEYQGYRKKFSQEGIEFIDLPNTVPAIQVFLKGRSEALISYESPFKAYMDSNHLAMPTTDSITPLLDIDAYYSVAKRSPHRNKLLQVFRDYATKHQTQYFLSAWQQKNILRKTEEF